MTLFERVRHPYDFHCYKHREGDETKADIEAKIDRQMADDVNAMTNMELLQLISDRLAEGG